MKALGKIVKIRISEKNLEQLKNEAVLNKKSRMDMGGYAVSAWLNVQELKRKFTEKPKKRKKVKK